MIRKGNECQIEYREHMRDGDGTVQLTNFITGPDELCERNTATTALSRPFLQAMSQSALPTQDTALQTELMRLWSWSR